MKKLIFTPGPVMMNKKVLNEGKKQPQYFRNKKFSDTLLGCKSLLLGILNAPKKSEVIFMAGSGTLGMEACVLNLICQDDKTCVINSGGFGQRFVDICTVKDIKTQDIRLSRNEKIDFNSIKPFNTLLLNAHETTIGRAFSLEKIGKICKKNNALFVVDAISFFGCDKIDMKKQNIDALIISSNKGLALPPGLVMVILSPKAIKNLKSTNSIYLDFKSYLKDIQRGQTPFTPPITILNQLHVRLQDMSKCGIDKQIQKTSNLAKYFRENIKDLPFEFYSNKMPNAMSALILTNGENASEFIKKFEKIYDITLTPSGGHLEKSMVRIGHMGDINKKDIKYLIKCLKKYFKVEA